MSGTNGLIPRQEYIEHVPLAPGASTQGKICQKSDRPDKRPVGYHGRTESATMIMGSKAVIEVLPPSKVNRCKKDGWGVLLIRKLIS